MKIDKPLQLYKKQAKSSPVETSGVECTLGCVLYCDENGDLAELPKTGLIEQLEWHGKTGGGMPEQWEPSMAASDLEGAPEALRRNTRLHKVSAVRKLFKDHAGHDEHDDISASPVSADEIRRRLLLLNRADIVGGESVALGATEADRYRKVHDLKVTASEKSRTDTAMQPICEVANDSHDENEVTDTEDDVQDNDAEELRITDIQTDSEEGAYGIAETKLAAQPIDTEDADGGKSGRTAEETATEEVITMNVEQSLTLGKEKMSKEQLLSETAEGNIIPSKCPMFYAVPNNDDTKNIPSSFSGVDVISMEQLPR